MFQTILTEIIKSGILSLEGIKIASMRNGNYIEYVLCAFMNNTQRILILPEFCEIFISRVIFSLHSRIVLTKLVKLFVNCCESSKCPIIFRTSRFREWCSLVLCQDEFQKTLKIVITQVLPLLSCIQPSISFVHILLLKCHFNLLVKTSSHSSVNF